MRFIHVQRHVASCGPIAIANLIKWTGTSTSYEKVLKYCTALRFYIPGVGMFPRATSYVLRKLKIKFTLRRDLTLPELDETLDRGGAVLLTYLSRTQFLHCVFVEARTESGYRVWNAVESKTPHLTREVMRECLDRSRRSKEIWAYHVLSKK